MSMPKESRGIITKTGTLFCLDDFKIKDLDFSRASMLKEIDHWVPLVSHAINEKSNSNSNHIPIHIYLFHSAPKTHAIPRRVLPIKAVQ